jgi:hypothetical protein
LENALIAEPAPDDHQRATRGANLLRAGADAWNEDEAQGEDDVAVLHGSAPAGEGVSMDPDAARESGAGRERLLKSKLTAERRRGE